SDDLASIGSGAHHVANEDGDDDTSFTADDFEPFVPTSSMAPTPPAVDALPTSEEDVVADDVEIEKAQEFTADSFEQDPYAIASNPLADGDATTFIEEPAGTIELATDIGLGLPED